MIAKDFSSALLQPLRQLIHHCMELDKELQLISTDVQLMSFETKLQSIALFRLRSSITGTFYLLWKSHQTST